MDVVNNWLLNFGFKEHQLQIAHIIILSGLLGASIGFAILPPTNVPEALFRFTCNVMLGLFHLWLIKKALNGRKNS